MEKLILCSLLFALYIISVVVVGYRSVSFTSFSSLVWVTVISRFIIFSGTGFHFLAKTVLNCIGRVKSVLPCRGLLMGDFKLYILSFRIGYSDNYEMI